MMKPLPSLALWIALALTAVAQTNAPAPAAKPPAALTDVDNRPVQIPIPGKATVVLYTKPDAQDEARAASKALDAFAGKAEFRYIVIADFRVADPGVRNDIKKEVRSNLDEEANRLRAAYRKNKNSGNPRPDLITIADFDGSAAAAAGWAAPSESVRAVIFDANGQEKKRFDPLDNPKALTVEVKTVVP